MRNEELKMQGETGVNMKKSVYIESTIPSYATARESADVIIIAHQALTKLFWQYPTSQKQIVFICQLV
jgi:phage-related protein